MAEALRHPHVAVTNVVGRIYTFVFPLPVTCFFAALLTDVAYAATAYLMWLHFSEWLLAVGLAFGGIAAVALLVEFFASRAARRDLSSTSIVGLFFAAMLVELANSFMHTIDGWTAVVPGGLWLSAIGAILCLAAAALLPRAHRVWFVAQEGRS